MSNTTTIVSTAVIPFSAFVSLSIYLASHPASPISSLVRRPVQLPVHRDEAFDGSLDADPFDLDDPVIRKDGYPVDAENFWSQTRGMKLAFLATLLLPIACNLYRLALIVTSHLDGEEHTRAMLVPLMLVPAHLVTLLLGYWYLSHTDTASHWNSTIHLAFNVFIQFLIIASISLLPSEPFPTPREALDITSMTFPLPKIPSSPLEITRMLLPLLHIPPLALILAIRRGPALHFPLNAIYPSRIVEAIPAHAPGLDPRKGNVNEEVQANIPEWLLFGYATNVVRRGSTADSTDVWDLPVLQSRMRAMVHYMTMKGIYGKQRKRLGRMEGFNLLIKLLQANKGPFLARAFTSSSETSLVVITAVGYYLPHYILRVFLSYLENDATRSNPAWGWLLAFGLFMSNTAMNLINGIIFSLSTTTLQAGIRLQLNTMLFSKTLAKKDIAAAAELKEQNAEKEHNEAGTEKAGSNEKDDDDDEGVSSKTQIMTLFTVDVDRVSEFVWHQFALVDAPIEIVVATIFLVQLLGSSAAFGLLAALICLPLNHIAAKVVVTAQENLMKARDSRTALMNEILQGIRMLKFMAWERSFEERINTIRQDELHWQARNYMIEVGFNCLWSLTPVLVTVVSFLHFTLVAKKDLTPSIAFTSVAVFAELRYALNALPETFIEALQGFVSCRRIEKYMSSAEIPRTGSFDHTGDIVLNNATFAWPRDDSSDGSADAKSTATTPKNAFTLADMTLRFPRGKLSLICGRLGSGKSLLLNGLLGEADVVSGQLSCPRSSPDLMATFETSSIKPESWIIPEMVAYVPQQAWLQNASIKDNIIFSSPWDEARYERVLEACSLSTDLEILEDGDQTEIGEKGLNLSGGQKARVSLARAVYSRAGLLLLDDVLSAVDAHTAHALMENCIQGTILAERTVLMVSHHTTLVSPAAAYIVALENGNIKFSGTRRDFVDCGLMNELDTEDVQKPAEEEKIEEDTIEKREKDQPSLKAVNKGLVSLSSGDVGTTAVGTPRSGMSSETSSIAPEDEATLFNSEENTQKKKAPRKLIEDEQRAKGRIAWPVWKAYFGALGGGIWWVFFVLALLVAMLVPVAENGWLERWTGSHSRENKHSSTYYVLGYCVITLVGVVAGNIQYAVVYYGSLQASRKLHNAMLKAVLFAQLRFHDTTSRGRLLNRFGKDIEGLDSSMADNFLRSLAYGLNVVVTFVSITYVGGLPFLAAGGLMLVLYYQAGSIYGQTSRDMRRLDSVTRSPLYSLFGETVSGVAVIRAFGASTIALKQMMRLSDTNLLAFYWSWTVNRWLSARFNFLSAIILGVTAVVILLSPNISASMAGFALAFATTISHNLLFVVRRFVQLEQSMVALERIKEYSELKQEAPEIVEPRPPASWPESGGIAVEDLVIRYAPDLPDVLHGINFIVSPKQKIGIVGATGCGKSTLALSFFRFVEATSGRITIDGLDIAKIGLTDLRTRVTIIPQDPTILSGTLRSTLDVFDEYDDVDIYAALKRVHLLKDEDLVVRTAATVGEEEGEERNVNVFRDLNNPVSEGGDNFSSGEKQLMCMARAILRRNKVLFMDEATASIDYETDELISKTIREEFSDSTILTIAHRIHTIIDFDKVLVMDRGRLVEFASPAELLRDHKSKFYSLCKATGRTEFKNLKSMAAEAERKRKAGTV